MQADHYHGPCLYKTGLDEKPLISSFLSSVFRLTIQQTRSSQIAALVMFSVERH